MAVDAAAFIRANTRPGRAALVPEVALHLADAVTPLWQASEVWLAEAEVAPPYWAFAWPGGQALARWVLDGPERVRGCRVLDFAAGCGIGAIACAQAGAGRVEAAEIDRVAAVAIGLNAGLNGVGVEVRHEDLVGRCEDWEMILCGDVCYEAPMTRHILPWLQACAGRAEVWIADPGRAYLPAGLTATACYEVPTSLDLEDRTMRRTTIYRLG